MTHDAFSDSIVSLSNFLNVKCDFSRNLEFHNNVTVEGNISIIGTISNTPLTENLSNLDANIRNNINRVNAVIGVNSNTS